MLAGYNLHTGCTRANINWMCYCNIATGKPAGPHLVGQHSWIQVTVEASIWHRAMQNRGWMNGTLRAEQRNKDCIQILLNKGKIGTVLPLLMIFYPSLPLWAPICSCVHRFSFGKFWPIFAKIHMNVMLLECTSKPYFMFTTSSNNNRAGVWNI